MCDLEDESLKTISYLLWKLAVLQTSFVIIDVRDNSLHNSTDRRHNTMCKSPG